MQQSVSQEKYCGGFSSVDPPLSIPNREVKRTYADGTDRPVGRVGSRRFSDSPNEKSSGLSLFYAALETKKGRSPERRLKKNADKKRPLKAKSVKKLPVSSNFFTKTALKGRFVFKHYFSRKERSSAAEVNLMPRMPTASAPSTLVGLSSMNTQSSARKL